MNIYLIDIADSDVVYEEYEDEIIFLQLREGFYYTLDRIAGDVVVALLRAKNVENALMWLLERYESDRDSMAKCCEGVLTHLENEKLFVERDVDTGDEGKLSLFSGEKQELKSFQIEKYEDIQDILTFDPVHEVNEDGWPSVVDK